MFYKIRVNSWSEAVSIYNLISLKSPIWAFRGQANSDWSLKTTFEREGERHKLDPYYYKICESNILTDFKRQAYQYVQNLPDKEELIDWLAFIQHFGGPTRLLDFTYSFYVAAFFAIQSLSDESAIWSININYLINQNETFSTQIQKIGYRKIISAYVSAANDNIKAKQNFNQKGAAAGVYIVEPFNQEQRLGIQQGLFLYPTDIEKPFHDNLSQALNTSKKNICSEELKDISYDGLSNINGDDLCLIKIIISEDMNYEAVNQLRNMNISDATLFPGIDGFARSLNFNFHDIKWSITKPRL